VGDMLGGGGASTEVTLAELAGKLAKLREHLHQVLVDLDAPARGRLRCHECGLTGSSEDAAGWTMRLCGDDELHAFCPDCDRRCFGATAAERRLS
jgi:hypothetical protein